ncbi:MAG: DNA polymerase III subunit delta [Terriglobia bacterium]
MRAAEFLALLEKGQLAPVYYFRGPDGFLHEECRSAVIDSLPKETREWCLTEIEFKPGLLHRHLEGAYQMPMLGGRSILYLADSEDYERASEEDVEALSAFLKNPPTFSTTIIAAREPDRRRRFIQLIEKGAPVVEMAPLAAREAGTWLVGYLKKAGIRIQPSLAESVAARFEAGAESSVRARGSAGVNLLWLRTEIEKLLVARAGASEIAESDLDIVRAPREEHEIGKLLNAIAGRQLSAALVLLRDLIASKEPETLLLWCVGDLFRQALKVPPGPARSAPWARAANPYATFEIAPRVQQTYAREEISRAIRFVRAADLAVKSSWKDSKIILEALLWQIMAGKDVETPPATWDPAAIPAIEM